MFTRLSATFKKPDSSNDAEYRIEFVQEGFCFLESDQPIRAAVGFVSFVPVHSVVGEAMSMFRKIRFPAAGFYLNSLAPFPANALEAFAEKVEKIVVIESSAIPLLSQTVRKKTWIKPVVMFPSYGGSITAREIFEKEDWI